MNRRWILFLLICVGAPYAIAEDCEEGLKSTCEEPSEFTPGRWAFTDASGTLTFGGTDETPQTLYGVGGTFQFERLGGDEANFIEIACDGSITGSGHDRLAGQLTHDALSHPACNYEDNIQHTIEIEREYMITGMVDSENKLILEYTVTNGTATIQQSQYLCFIDVGRDECVTEQFTYGCSGQMIDLAGQTDRVIIEGTLNSETNRFMATETSEVELLMDTEYGCDPSITSTWIHAFFWDEGSFPFCQHHEQWPGFFASDCTDAEVDMQVNTTLERKTGIATDAQLEEPAYFLGRAVRQHPNRDH